MLCGAEFKGDGLTNLTEEISREPSTQAAAWILLIAFSQIDNENCEQKSEWRAGGVAQAVVCPPCKHESLSSNPTTVPKMEEKAEKKDLKTFSLARKRVYLKWGQGRCGF
jgi:hypothetical protein